MKRPLLRRVLILVVLAGILMLPLAASARPTHLQPAITSVNAVCTNTGSLQATVDFVYTGQTEVRIYGLYNGTRTDSDHLWFYGSGTATFIGYIAYVGPEYVEARLLKVAKNHTLVDIVDPVTVGPYTC